MAHMDRPLKILFLMEDLCFGGTQRQSLALAQRMDRNLFAPAILTLTGRTDLDALAEQADIPVYHLGHTRKVISTFFVRLASALVKIKPDILLPCTALPNIWGRIWGRLLHVPVVVGTCRGGGAPVRQHERWLWRLTQHMICNSAPLKAHLQRLGVPETHMTCIPNGVDPDFFIPGNTPNSMREKNILCVARLAKDKDHLTLFNAFGLLLKKMPQLRLRLVGDGPEETRLKAYVREKGLGQHVDFCKGTVDVSRYYQDASLFVLSSVREGLPNVLLEAMSCGLPICATSVGGIPDLVRNGENGLLSPPGDAAAFADNCCALLDQPDLLDKMGICNRRKIESEFSYAVMVSAHQTLFQTLWHQRKSS